MESFDNNLMTKTCLFFCTKKIGWYIDRTWIFKTNVLLYITLYTTSEGSSSDAGRIENQGQENTPKLIEKIDPILADQYVRLRNLAK